MKKISSFIILLVALLLTSCSNDDYRNVIPSDASFVVGVNLGSLAEKSDIEHSKYMHLFQASLSTIVPNDELDDVRELIDRPEKIGLDLTAPVYFFGTAGNQLGLVAKVADHDDVEDFVDMLHDLDVASRPKEKSGVTECTLIDEVLCLYTDRAFLLYVDQTSQSKEVARKLATQLLNQGADDSFANTANFDRMEEASADISYYVSADVISKSKLLVSERTSKDSWLNDLFVIGSLTFDSGRALMVNNILPLNEADKAKMDEFVLKHLRPIEGRYLKMQNGPSPVWGCLGVDGKWLLDECLKDNNDIKGTLFMLERCVDIEQMLRSVDGDITFSIGNFIFSEPNISVMARVKETKFLSDVDYWQKSMKDYGMSMDRLSDNDYVVHLGDGKRLYWGVNDKDLYMSNIGRPTLDSDQWSSLADDIKSSYFYLVADLQQIGDMIDEEELAFLKSLDKLMFKIKSSTELDIEVTSQNKEENILKTLLR